MSRIVHLGLGQFHRAHQAWYTHAAGGGWTITGVAMRNPTVLQHLRARSAYDLVTRGADGVAVTQIDVHDRVLLAATSGAEVIGAIADARCAVVTLTITEKGYGLGDDGKLDLSLPWIMADLTAPEPASALGILAQGLARRQAAGLPPLTVLSCDNLAANGRLLRQAVLRFSEAAGLDPAGAEHARFPATMVDRITPQMAADLHASLTRELGRPLHAPVLTEAFTEWVIEEDFVQDRPAWDRAGAQFVTDVHGFEQRKLLFLNGAHSALAYLGLGRGLTYVHEAIGDPTLRATVLDLWEAATPLVPAAAQAGLGSYCAQLLQRFAVPEMRHELAQIAQDGSLKLPQRILPVLRHSGFADPAATAVIRAWMRFVRNRATSDGALLDPKAAMIRDAVAPARTAAEQRDLLLACLGIARGDAPRDWPDPSTDA